MSMFNRHRNKLRNVVWMLFHNCFFELFKHLRFCFDNQQRFVVFLQLFFPPITENVCNDYKGVFKWNYTETICGRILTHAANRESTTSLKKFFNTCLKIRPPGNWFSNFFRRHGNKHNWKHWSQFCARLHCNNLWKKNNNIENANTHWFFDIKHISRQCIWPSLWIESITYLKTDIYKRSTLFEFNKHTTDKSLFNLLQEQQQGWSWRKQRNTRI